MLIGNCGDLAFLVPGLDSTALASQQVGQAVLDGKTIPKFVEPVPLFNGNRVDGTKSLTVTAQEFQQKILPVSFTVRCPIQ